MVLYWAERSKSCKDTRDLQCDLDAHSRKQGGQRPKEGLISKNRQNPERNWTKIKPQKYLWAMQETEWTQFQGTADAASEERDKDASL